MALQDLISVTYEDKTNYNVPSTGEDVLGIVINHHWGPADRILSLNKADFFRYFPDSMPMSRTTVNVENYHAFALVAKAFDTGISKVEVVRFNNPSGNNSAKWKFYQWEIRKSTADASVVGLIAGKTYSMFNHTDETLKSQLTISLKYPGIPPQSLISGDTVAIKVKIKNNVVYIDVLAKNGTEYTTVESFEGGLNPTEVVEGQNYFIESVVEKSQLISVKTFASTIADVAESIADAVFEQDPTFGVDDYQKVIEVYEDQFADIEKSTATLLVSPFAKEVEDEAVDNAIIKIAEKCQDRIAVVGYPIDKTFRKSVNGDPGEDSILGHRKQLYESKFAVFVAGRELIKILGQSLTSNCVGGWCGATAKVAKENRINQLASAKTFGTYKSILLNSLKFDEVLDMHDNYGVISIYNASQGPTIFGLRTLNARQNSYFAKANVMRVTAAILKRIFPMCIDVLHTDVAANEMSRTLFESSLNSVIAEFVTNQNLKPQSNAQCDSTLNSDINTRGGEVLEIVLNLWFIKLTERINIKIIATDSSVTAQI